MVVKCRRPTPLRAAALQRVQPVLVPPTPSTRSHPTTTIHPPTPPCHPQTGPGVSLLLSLFGIAMGYLSTFWAFGYTRLSRRMFRFLDTGSPRIRRYDVIGTLEKVGLLGL